MTVVPLLLFRKWRDDDENFYKEKLEKEKSSRQRYLDEVNKKAHDRQIKEKNP